MPPKRVDANQPKIVAALRKAVMYTFTIKGKIKPYVRMTQRGKWSNPQAQEYLANQDDIRWQLARQGRPALLPAKTPLNVSLVFTFPGGWHNADLDNQIKAVLDAAKGIVWQDDRWIDSLYGARKAGDDYLCTLRVEVARVDTVDEALAAVGAI